MNDLVQMYFHIVGAVSSESTVRAHMVLLSTAHCSPEGAPVCTPPAVEGPFPQASPADCHQMLNVPRWMNENWCLSGVLICSVQLQVNLNIFPTFKGHPQIFFVSCLFMSFPIFYQDHFWSF